MGQSWRWHLDRRTARRWRHQPTFKVLRIRPVPIRAKLRIGTLTKCGNFVPDLTKHGVKLCPSGTYSALTGIRADAERHAICADGHSPPPRSSTRVLFKLSRAARQLTTSLGRSVGQFRCRRTAVQPNERMSGSDRQGRASECPGMGLRDRILATLVCNIVVFTDGQGWTDARGV